MGALTDRLEPPFAVADPWFDGPTGWAVAFLNLPRR